MLSDTVRIPEFYDIYDRRKEIGGVRTPLNNIVEQIAIHTYIYFVMNRHHQKNDEEIGTCSICDRPMVAGISSDKHHWIPQSKGGKKGEVAVIHRICHDKIHSVWSEKELARVYNNAEVIKNAPEMAEFLSFVKKKDASFYMVTKRHNRRR